MLLTVGILITAISYILPVLIGVPLLGSYLQRVPLPCLGAQASQPAAFPRSQPTRATDNTALAAWMEETGVPDLNPGT